MWIVSTGIESSLIVYGSTEDKNSGRRHRRRYQNKMKVAILVVRTVIAYGNNIVTGKQLEEETNNKAEYCNLRSLS